MKLERQQMDGDVVVQALFDEMPDLEKDDDRLSWNLTQGLNVCRWTAKTSGAMSGFTGILEELGEGPAWEFLADVADHSGFDVYNGDGVFEVYERSTVSATGQEGDDEMPRQTVGERIQKEIEKVDEKIAKVQQTERDLVIERDQLVKALSALKAPSPED